MSTSPYQDLVVYYVEGRLKPFDALASSSGFIGNWEEDGDSFLFFDHPADSVVDSLLQNQPHLVLVDTYRMKYEDWQGGVLRPFSVLQRPSKRP